MPLPLRSHYTLTQAIVLGLALFLLTASARPIDSGLFNKWTNDIERARKNIAIQGTSVAVVYKGKIIYAKGFGKRNDVDPFTPETIVPIGSLTKSFTAGAIGELVAKKKASWDVSVNEYLPEFQFSDPRLTAETTFVDLLSHRTGLAEWTWEWLHRPEPRIELIKQLKHAHFDERFRTTFLYNNALISVAGEAGARIAGSSYENLVRKTITRPLGMKKTGFSNKEMITKSNYALPYLSKNFEAAQRGENYAMELDTSYMADMPAGGMHSNVIELANWAKAIMHGGALDGKQILNKESMDQLTSAHSIQGRQPRMPEFSISNYGLCLSIEHYKGHRTVHHSGSFFGYISNLVTFPDDDLAIINLSNHFMNLLPAYLPYYIADDVLDLPKTQDWLFNTTVAETKILYKVKGTENLADLETRFPPQIKDKPATRSLSDFAGDYTHPVAGNLSFELVNGGNKTDGANPEAKDGVLAFRYLFFSGQLEHYHYDSFRLRVIDKDYFSLSVLVTFVTDADGLVKECHVFGRQRVPLVYTRV